MSKPARTPLRYTQNGVYLVTVFTLCIIIYDSTQTITQRYHINKKWFYLYGALGFVSYLYLRPAIRRNLGSASQAYINWSAIYILWLCSAVFYHTPSLDSLGVDVKADVSILLTVFMLSLALLMSLWLLYWAAVSLNLLAPRLYESADGKNIRTWVSVLLNALNFAVACSSYYSFCGNAAVADPEATLARDFRQAVCSRWLQPLPALRHPVFSAWVIYGESVGQGTALISPVFTMWLTLFALFSANCLAVYASSATMAAAKETILRPDSANKTRPASSSKRMQRRRSADFTREMARFDSTEALLSFLPTSDSYVSLAGRVSLDVLLRTVNSVGNMWSPRMGVRRASALLFRDDSGVGLAAGGASSDDKAAGDDTEQQPALAPAPAMVPFDSPAPSFLPMFPWYSGTEADLFKTLFDVMVSVKVFLGRFDMRTMQAAVAGSGAGGGPPPTDGDGFTFEHLAGQQEAWIDFFADTGDGGDPTYSIARALAAHQVTVAVPKELQGQVGGAASVQLPRAQALVHGGDLAYPNPTDETYQQRLFGPYEAAFPPPSHVHPGHLVLNKPDLPAEYWRQVAPCTCGARGSGSGSYMDGSRQLCTPCQKAAALAAYDGPTCFLIPGNHDWFDGLETFQRHVVHKGWLGGWLLPQERSYYALHLPHGWWLFAVDLALVDDIDMLQYRYFARIAEERMAPGDACIVVTHCPAWLLSWFWGESKSKSLRQLIRGPLRGKVRLQLAGDLHFYMRHSFKPYQPEGPPSLAPSEQSTPAGGSPTRGGSPAGGSPLASRSPSAVFSPPVTGPSLAHMVSDKLAAEIPALRSRLGSACSPPGGVSLSAGTSPPSGPCMAPPSLPRLKPNDALPNTKSNLSTERGSGLSRPTSPEQRQYQQHFGSGCAPGAASPPALPASWWPDHNLRVTTGSHGPGTAAGGKDGGDDGTGWVLNEAEHLIVSGAGGAFLHPTHVFDQSRFRPVHDPAAGPVFLQQSKRHKATGLGKSYPSSSSLYSMGHADSEGPTGGEYRCSAAYPSPKESMHLGRLNLHMFRNVNNRFDIIGGALYFLLVISVLPRCSVVEAVLDAHSPWQAIGAFFTAALTTTCDIFGGSYVSLAALAFLAVMCLGFCSSGGVGVVQLNADRGYGPPGSKRPQPENFGFKPAVKVRMGGQVARLAFGGLHCLAHLTAAVCLLLLLELGVEMMVRYEGVGQEGYHSLYQWYRAFEVQHFPDPAGLRGRVSSWTLGLYPNAIKWLMAVFDVPEAIAVSRAAICGGGAAAAALTRIQALAYYIGVLMYFWVLATPTVGYLFGLYLYISVNWLHVHYDEAFSSLQVPDYKGFLRLHITPTGDLEVYALGMDKVPKAWREDPRWKGPKGAGKKGGGPAHKALYPSRWIPVEEGMASSGWGKTAQVPEDRLKLVDYVLVPQQQANVPKITTGNMKKENF